MGACGHGGQGVEHGGGPVNTVLPVAMRGNEASGGRRGCGDAISQLTGCGSFLRLAGIGDRTCDRGGQRCGSSPTEEVRGKWHCELRLTLGDLLFLITSREMGEGWLSTVAE
jgi:hypothetical protein